MTLLRSVMILVNLLGPFVASELTPIVETSDGAVQGVILKTYDYTKYSAFKGIPYAAPPTGNKRFKPPVPVARWEDVLLTTAEKEKCPQYEGDSKVVGSEDCLYLNVFTPEVDFTARPRPDGAPTRARSVMVWFHDGIFATGSGGGADRHPDFFISKDIILVTLNYRLGALGFLRLDHPHAAGNQGLKDQKLALEWVRGNIGKFGGNPDSVTIFGKNAGAASVGYHVLSEASRGLFHGAISMSGTPLAPWAFVTRAEAIQRGRQLAELVGKRRTFPFRKDGSLLKTLRKATLEELLSATVKIDRIAAFVPTLEEPDSDEAFLTECSARKYRKMSLNKVPQLLGVTKGETWRYFDNADDADALIKKSIAYMKNMIDDPTKQDYLRLALPFAEYPENPASLVSVTSDILFKTPVEATLKLLLENKNDIPIFYYDDMTFPADSASSTSQMDHVKYASDLAYIFYNPITDRRMNENNPMGRTIRKVFNMWTNFAKHSDPTPVWLSHTEWNPKWPEMKKTEQALEIGREVKIVEKRTDTLATSMKLPYENHLDVFADC